MKIGIGVDQTGQPGQPSSGWNLAYAWATTFAPSIQTTQQQDVSVSSVIANEQASVLVPTVSTSSSVSTSVLPSVSSASASSIVPTVSTTKSPNIVAVIANEQATAGVPSVSTGSTVNTSVSSVVAGSTASAGVPTVSATSSTTTTYLQMDGVDDRLSLPSMTYNKIVIDCNFTPPNDSTLRYFFDSSSRSTGGYIRFTGQSIAGNMSPTGVVFGSRTTITGTIATVTMASSFGATFSNSNWLAMNIYDIKIYNSATLVAHYDMSTGNVNDQTGNGYNATNTDGMWVTG